MIYDFFCFFTLLLLCLAVGLSLLRWASVLDTESPLSKQVGASFFAGIAYLVVAVRISAFVFHNADIGFKFGLISSVLICALGRKFPYAFAVELKNRPAALLSALITFLATALIVLTYNLATTVPFEEINNIGSLHSYRYASIASFFKICNFIPIVGQNTAQSILAFSNLMLGGRAAYLFLYLWLTSSVFFISFFLYGFFIEFLKKSAIAFMSTLIVILGNSALSLSHVLVNDSGSPIVCTGYTDTILGAFSIIMIINLFSSMDFSDHHPVGVVRKGVVGVLLGVVSSFCAPQNLILGFGFSVLIGLWGVIKNERSLKLLAIFSCTLCVLSLLIGVPMGGMLTPSGWQSQIKVMGLESVGGFGLAWNPGFPFHIQFAYVAAWGLNHKLTVTPDIQLPHAFHFPFFIWNFEEKFFEAVRILFFPIVGVIALYRENPKTSRRGRLALYGSIFILLGFLITFPVSISGRKWQASRFLVPGITTGMLCLGLYLAQWAVEKTNRVKLFIAITLFVIAGPTANVIATITRRTIYDSKKQPFGDRLLFMLKEDPILQNQTCK